MGWAQGGRSWAHGHDFGLASKLEVLLTQLKGLHWQFGLLKTGEGFVNLH